MSIDLSHAFGMEPEQAVKFFESKGYAITWNWRENWQEAQSKAFTVAGITKLDMLQDIRQEMGKALKEGNTFADFRANLQPLLQRKGWWGDKAQTDMETGEVHGKGLTPRRLRTIFDTNVQSAYNAGRWTEAQANAHARPYVQYVALHGGHRRPAHQLLDLRVFRIDDPIWNSLCPTNGYGCKCRFRTLSQLDMDRKGIAVSSGKGHMEAVQVPYSSKSTNTVEVVGYRDPISGKLITPDPGFSYNAAKSWAKPFTPPPANNLPQTFPQGVSLPGMPQPAKVPASRVLNSGEAPEHYVDAFLKEFGATMHKPVVFKDVIGNALPINQDLFKDASGKWAALKSNLERYLTILPDAIKSPDEVWLRWEESAAMPGSWMLKRRYIKTFEIDGQGEPKFGVSVVEIGKDGWTGSTTVAIQRSAVERQRSLERERDGFLLYRKK